MLVLGSRERDQEGYIGRSLARPLSRDVRNRVRREGRVLAPGHDHDRDAAQARQRAAGKV